MVDIEKLKKEMKETGLSMTVIAKKSGIIRETLYNRLNGIGEFTASEIIGLSRALRFDRNKREDIFFNENVDYKSKKN